MFPFLPPLEVLTSSSSAVEGRACIFLLYGRTPCTNGTISHPSSAAPGRWLHTAMDSAMISRLMAQPHPADGTSRICPPAQTFTSPCRNTVPMTAYQAPCTVSASTTALRAPYHLFLDSARPPSYLGGEQPYPQTLPSISDSRVEL